MSVWFIWSKPLGRMGHDMLKWLVNYLSNKLALCLYKGEFRFKVSERKYNMAANENFGHLFDYHKNKKDMQKWRKLSPDYVDTLNS